MTTGLHALCNDRVHACLGRSDGFLDRADLDVHFDATPMSLLDVGRGIAPEQHQQGYVCLEAGLDIAFLERGQDDVHSERLVRQHTQVLNLFPEV
jgi:hypothetical protein